MTKLEKIEHDITTLSREELQKLSDWLAEYQADLWDRQIVEDAKAGKLDRLIEEAKKDIAAGKIRPL
jgi:predicted nucleic acid-binding protein